MQHVRHMSVYCFAVVHGSKFAVLEVPSGVRRIFVTLLLVLLLLLQARISAHGSRRPQDACPLYHSCQLSTCSAVVRLCASHG